MSNYQKFDTSIIKNRIKEGAYPSLVGANRAIGKTQGLTDDDRAALKKIAAKHFGETVSEAAPKKKAAKKAAVKKPAKVAKKKAPKTAKKKAKKAAKKTGKRTPKAAKPAAEAAPAKAEPAPAAEPKAKATRAKRGAKAAQASKQLELPLGVKHTPPPPSKLVSFAEGPVETARLMGGVISSCDTMLKAINSANSILPKDVAETGNSAAVKVMTRAVNVLDQDVVTPLLNVSTTVTTTAGAKVRKTRKPAPVVEAPPESTDDGDSVQTDDGLPLSSLESDSEEAGQTTDD